MEVTLNDWYVNWREAGVKYRCELEISREYKAVE